MPEPSYANSVSPRVILVDGERLAALMIDHNVGVALYTVKGVDTSTSATRHEDGWGGSPTSQGRNPGGALAAEKTPRVIGAPNEPEWVRWHGASLLTDELRAQMERELAAGAPVAVAAQRVGIGRRTLTRWLAQGRVVRPQLASAPADPLDLGPARSLDDRLAKAEPGLVGVIAAAAGRGSWQAAAWILERRWPERWARPPVREAEAVRRSEPREDDPFAEVDEIAARRRRKPRPATGRWRAYSFRFSPLKREPPPGSPSLSLAATGLFGFVSGAAAAAVITTNHERREKFRDRMIESADAYFEKASETARQLLQVESKVMDVRSGLITNDDPSFKQHVTDIRSSLGTTHRLIEDLGPMAHQMFIVYRDQAVGNNAVGMRTALSDWEDWLHVLADTPNGKAPTAQ